MNKDYTLLYSDSTKSYLPFQKIVSATAILLWYLGLQLASVVVAFGSVLLRL